MGILPSINNSKINPPTFSEKSRLPEDFKQTLNDALAVFEKNGVTKPENAKVLAKLYSSLTQLEAMQDQRKTAHFTQSKRSETQDAQFETLPTEIIDLMGHIKFHLHPLILELSYNKESISTNKATSPAYFTMQRILNHYVESGH